MRNRWCPGLILLICSLGSAAGQTFSVSGMVADAGQGPLPYATVALLSPSDSTVVSVCLTGTQGGFEMNRIHAGQYLLQVSFVGYQTFFRNITLTGTWNFGVIVLESRPRELQAAEITADRIPMQFRKDTLEYNAGAFKTMPDAVAEDLLRKLPGVEVDRAGNIKALGDQVNHVLVDGKEFFSPDPKIATKNLPAESIKKVQVYDKKSDESELIGLDDSEYDKTINFVLKDDAKKALFGDVQAGAGSAEAYQGRGKLYRFTDRHQFAGLGMLNNINKPGFSIQDYMDFNGGLRNAMTGGTVQISLGDDEGIPIDFGNTIEGRLTSGAGGLNYSFEPVKNNRFNISYMGNGSRKAESRTVASRQLTGDAAFRQESLEQAKGNDLNHLLNLGWRNKSGSRRHFMLNAILAVQHSHSGSELNSKSFTGETITNLIENTAVGNRRAVNSTLDGSWLQKGNDRWKMVKISGQVRFSGNTRDSEWNNLSQTNGNPGMATAGFLTDRNNGLRYEVSATSLRSLGKGFYLAPEVTAGYAGEWLTREQGTGLELPVITDSLSPGLSRSYPRVTPSIHLKKYGKKFQFSLGLGYLSGNQTSKTNGAVTGSLRIYKPLPQARLEYEFRTGRKLSLQYQASVTLPSLSQLLPVISTSNPFILLFGNPALQPELRHDAGLSWLFYDQFSFTSLFAGVDGSYVRDRIGQSVVVDEQLRQQITLVNTPEAYSGSAFLDFSTPVRPLGLTFTLGLRETGRKGISYVNQLPNTNTSVTHQFRIKLDNRKKEFFDVEIGSEVAITRARYSIMDALNTRYYSTTFFGTAHWTPNGRWDMRFSADLTTYSNAGFGQVVNIPILAAGISYYFNTEKTAVLVLEGADLLDRNTGYSRVTENNALQEIRATVLGRYVMLSFRYRIKP